MFIGAICNQVIHTSEVSSVVSFSIYEQFHYRDYYFLLGFYIWVNP